MVKTGTLIKYLTIGFCVVACGISSLQAQQTAAYVKELGKNTPVQKKAGSALPSNPLVIRLEPLSTLFGTDSFENKMVRLNVEVRQPDLNRWSGFRVFLNLPENTLNPSSQDRFYVGRASFYGGQPGESVSFMFNLSQTIKVLTRENLLTADEPLKITIIPVASMSKNRIISSNGLIVKSVNVELPKD